MALLGLDLGGTKLSGGLFDLHGRCLERRETLLAGRSGSDVGTEITTMLADLRLQARVSSVEISGIGVSVPGIAHPNNGKVWAPNISGWDNYPLRDEIRAAVGPAGLPVIVDSDRACSILGERWQGAARGARHAVFLAVGTGIGAGILVNGDVLRGAQDIAGATGWMALDQPFREEYVQCGCFEYHASGPGLAGIARNLIAEQSIRSPRLSSIPFDRLTAHDVFAAHEANDPVAKEVIRRAIIAWGAAAANFVSLLNPELIIFGGGVFGPAVRFIDDIRREAAKWAQPISMRSVRFVPSALGNDAALIGAASLTFPAGHGDSTAIMED